MVARRRILTTEQLIEFHERLQRVSVLFWQNSRETAESEWRGRCTALLEDGDLDGANAGLERMRQAAEQLDG
jgi:hypothetical protein